ncbi:hypothetical protein [Lelliottia sp. JS-SCA-14]|uniref:ParE family toxin-like protein n=1 Tax=Lelliottia sp. JS-SCA-14 TaxID=3110110 RepID=UPI002D7A38BD|nr:hypothetical protein [Lelliottia sp. JS-SCA-14]
MAIRLQISCAAPLCVSKRAAAELSHYSKGRKNYSRILPHHYLVIRLGCRWRLLSKNGGKAWSLLTHEKYNVESKK